jgi:MFS family permease
MVFLGCVTVGMGVQQQEYSMVLYGRVLFALFQSVLSSVASLVTFRLFKTEAARAFAYSLIIFANRVGAISGFFFSGRVLSEVTGKVDAAVWISVVPTGICLLASLLFAYFYRGTSTARLVRPLLNPSRTAQAAAQTAGNDGNSTNVLKMAKQLPSDFWVLFVLIGCCYGVILPFETVAVNFFQERYKMDATTAGALLSVCPAFALLSPIFTSFVYEGKRQVQAALLATLCITGSIVAMYLGAQMDVFSLILLLGAGYMLSTNVVWVLVPQIVSQSGPLQTVAIGVAGVSNSLFIAIANYIVGVLRGNTGSYDAPLLFLSVLSLVGLGCSVKLVQAQKLWKSRSQPSLSESEIVQEEVRVTRLSPSSPFIEPEYRRSSLNN